MEETDTISKVIEIMKEKDLSQLPVKRGEKIVGSITEGNVLNFVFENPNLVDKSTIKDIMQDPFPTVKEDLPCSQLGNYFTRQNPAVIAEDKAGELYIITKYDVIQSV